MRMRNWILVAPIVGSLFLTGEFAFGQPPRVNNPYLGQPRVSPYVNLLRGGNQALIYRGLIQPQVEFQQFQQQQSAFNRQFQQGLLRSSQQGSGFTGHATSFLNYSHYYSLGRR